MKMNAKNIILVFSVLVAMQCAASDGAKKGACKSSTDCGFRGVCKGEGENAYCDCVKGVSGDHCQIVDGCAEVCGSAPGVECDFNMQHKVPHCFCEEEGKRYDVEQRKCVEQKPCKEYRDCNGGGRCEWSEDSNRVKRYCNCIHGTSGDFCERIEECISNPSMCGDGSDVECRFNSITEKAHCHCKNGTQRFDLPQRKCVDRSSCKENDDCLPYGVCTKNCQSFEACSDSEYFENKKSCHCVLGTSGANCEVIDDCFNNEVNCGNDGSAYCSFFYDSGLRARGDCKCKDPKKMFDWEKLTCRN